MSGAELLRVAIAGIPWRTDDAALLASCEMRVVGRCHVTVAGGGRFHAFVLSHDPSRRYYAAYWVRTDDGDGRFALEEIQWGG